MGALYRIRFHMSMYFRKLRSDINDLLHPMTREEILDEFYTSCKNTPPEDAADIKQTLREHRENEPKLNPRRTMLIQSRPDENSCNMLTAGSYQQKILNAVEWGKEHGITTFLVDYATPLGILALETLVELRKTDDAFRVYSVKSLPITKRKTYRLIPETGAELAMLSTSTDYSFSLMPDETILRILPNAAILCSEAGLWFAKDKLPDYLLKTWETLDQI